MSLDLHLPSSSFASHSNYSSPISNNEPSVEHRSSGRWHHKFRKTKKDDKYSVAGEEQAVASRVAPSAVKNSQSSHLSNSNSKMAVGFRNVHIPRPSEMRERFQPVEGTSGLLLLCWTLSAMLAVIVPVSKWSAERGRYYRYAGQYQEYEQQQRQYEEQANGNYNGGNGNGGYYQLCSWYDFKCRYRLYRFQQMYGNYGGEGGGQGGERAQMRAMLPGWYFFFGGQMEGDEREREEMGMTQNEGGMKFVYACTILMFVALSVFGFRSMYNGKDRSGVVLALLIFGMFSLMNLLTTVQGTIETDNRFFENSVYGWFGQWSVLVAYTDFWLMLHCFIFAGFLSLARCIDKRAKRDSDVDAQHNLEMGYRADDGSVITESRYS